MKRSQWSVLVITFWILMFLFIGLDLMNSCSPFSFSEDLVMQKINSGELTYEEGFAEMERIRNNEKNIPLTEFDVKNAVMCVVNGEINEPFIFLFFILAIAFSICACLEPKNK